ncbi:hypothetical protein HDU67_002515 [Dinochytrium kinnereticum]|nr:hypothetical protein HDU67_002515 [Dinochytrium kinnereticum]
MHIALSLLAVQAMLSGLVMAGGGSSDIPNCPYTRTSLLSSYIPLANPDLGVQSLFSKYVSKELLVGTNDGLYSSTNGGKSFTTLIKNGANYWGAIKTPAGTYIASTPQALVRSTNGGKTFSAVPDLMAPGGYPVMSTAGDMFAQIGSQIVWGTQVGFYISDDDGATWDALDCRGLIALANTPNQTINECEYLFVRSMALTPDSKQVLSVFTALGLSGLYALNVPVPRINGVLTPKFEAVVAAQLCPRLPQDSGEGTLCPQSGPITVWNGKAYVGSHDQLLAIPFPPSSPDVVPVNVLSAPTVETEMVGLAVSLDQTTLVASWSGAAFSTTNGVNWVQPNPAKCSTLPPFPTNPRGYFTRSIAPSGNAGSVFAFGTSYGHYILNTKP